MKIKKRYRKFLKLWMKRIELEGDAVIEKHENSEFIEYRIDILGGRRTIFIGRYNLILCEFFCNPWLNNSEGGKCIKVLMENGLKERVKVLVDEF